MKTLFTAHKIYHRIDRVKLWYLNMLEIDDRSLADTNDTWSHYCEHLCQVISKSLDSLKSYRSDTTNTLKQTMLAFYYQMCASGCCAWHISFLLWTFVPSIFKMPWWMRKLWTGNKIYPITDYVYFRPPTVTLTLKVGNWLISMTHRLIIVNICAK
jgi:hypothetical protein